MRSTIGKERSTSLGVSVLKIISPKIWILIRRNQEKIIISDQPEIKEGCYINPTPILNSPL